MYVRLAQGYIEHTLFLKAENGEAIARSEGYSSKAACLNGIESVMKNALLAEIKEVEQ